jgi:hypothetical protein
VVIPIGLAILAIEFTWARHWLRKVRELIAQYNGNVSTPDSTSRAREGSKNDVA